jgi:hypothetical protein
VLRLKEVFSNVSQDKEKLAEENRQLRHLLSSQGVSGMSAVLGGGSVLDDSMSNPSIGYASSASPSGSYAQAPSSNTSAFTPPLSATNMAHSRGGVSPLAPTHQHSHQHAHGHHQHHHSGQGQQLLPGAGGSGGQPVRNPNVDYDQAGIDFVLTYENPSQAYVSPPPP